MKSICPIWKAFYGQIFLRQFRDYTVCTLFFMIDYKLVVLKCSVRCHKSHGSRKSSLSTLKVFGGNISEVAWILKMIWVSASYHSFNFTRNSL